MTQGQLIRRRRLQLGLTQLKLASLIGIEQSVISRLENDGVVSDSRRLAVIEFLTKDDPFDVPPQPEANRSNRFLLGYILGGLIAATLFFLFW